MNYRNIPAQLERSLFDIGGRFAGNVSRMARNLYEGIGGVLNGVYTHKGRIALISATFVGELGAYDAVANPPAVRKENQNLAYWNGIEKYSSLSEELKVSGTIATSALEYGRNGSNSGSSGSARGEAEIANYAEVPADEALKDLKFPSTKGVWWYDLEAGIFRLYNHIPVLGDLTTIKDGEFYWVPAMADMEITGTDPSTHKPKVTRLNGGWNLVRGYDIIHPRLITKYSIDTDGDGLSNWFEERYSKTDPLVRNERYAILMNTWEDPDFSRTHPRWSDKDLWNVTNTRKYLVLNFGWKPENVIELPFKDASYRNFSEAVEKVAKKATPNDLVLIGWSSHGGEGYMLFQCSWILGGSQVCEKRTYEELNALINQIKPKDLILAHEASASKTMLKYFTDGPSPRVIFSNGGLSFLHDFRYRSFQRLFDDEDGQFSLSEISLSDSFTRPMLDKKSFEEFLRNNPEQSGKINTLDTDYRAGKIYLGENRGIGWREFTYTKID